MYACDATIGAFSTLSPKFADKNLLCFLLFIVYTTFVYSVHS